VSIRLIVRRTDTSNMTSHGGTHITSYLTFDIEHTEVEKLLRERNHQYEQHEVVGVELLAPKEQRHA
jgi:hypothetical protein